MNSPLYLSSSKLRYLTLIALLTAQSLILFFVEMIIPFPSSIPGAKLGLASLITLYALYKLPYYQLRTALSVITLRTLIASLLFTGPIILIYSLVAGVTSLLAMYVMQKGGFFSLIGVSVVGGFVHNLSQLIIASIMLGSDIFLLYLPLLGIIGVLAGASIGYLSSKIFPLLPTPTQ